MSAHVERGRRRANPPAVGARRFGYSVGITVNLLLLYLVNRSPGWQVVPFLTDDMAQVIGLVNASLLAGVVANALYVVADPRWLRALGEAVTTSIGLAAMLRLWTVWPFDFGTTSVDWEQVTRVVLAFGIGGSAIAILVSLVSLVRGSTDRH